MVVDAVREQLAGRHVLVTGATGFIGSHLIKGLVSSGAHVTAVAPTLGWRPIVSGLVRQGTVRFLKLKAFWSPTSVRRVKPGFGNVEYVVHLGYVMPGGKSLLENAVDDVRRNVLGTLRFMQALPDSVSKICFASSAMVYGPTAPEPVPETNCAHPVTVYAAGKLATETYLRLHAAASGVSVSILRYATVYGPMETVPRAIPNFIRQVLADRSPIIYGEGNDIRDYIHVFDVVDATMLALAQDDFAIQVYNVGTGVGYTTREIAKRIVHLTGKPVKPIHKPADHESYRLVCDISRARSTLGYEPRVDLNDGLTDEIRYYANNPHLWRNQ